MINEKEFDVLTALLENKIQSQRELAKSLAVSVGTVNKLLTDLTAHGLVEDLTVTAAGLQELAPYRVKKAVFLAAGFGSRLVPITLNTPKPLVKVNGVRIIDTLLDAVLAAGITDITIVRGYLGEQFDQLLYKYPNLKFVTNTAFNEANNISSALCVCDDLRNAYVLESDILLYHPEIIKKYQYSSNILGFAVDRTDDWCLQCDHNRVIKEEKIGGENCYQMVGISYWNETDGAQLAIDIPKIFKQPGGKERYWEQVPFVYCKQNYQVKVRPCQREDVVEIDTFNELKQLDPLYKI